MENNNELKEINIKYSKFYYFNVIINIQDTDLDNIFLDEKSYKNVLIYDVAYKTLHGAKPLHIAFGKVNGCIKNMIKLKI